MSWTQTADTFKRRPGISSRIRRAIPPTNVDSRGKRAYSTLENWSTSFVSESVLRWTEWGCSGRESQSVFRRRWDNRTWELQPSKGFWIPLWSWYYHLRIKSEPLEDFLKLTKRPDRWNSKSLRQLWYEIFSRVWGHLGYSQYLRSQMKPDISFQRLSNDIKEKFTSTSSSNILGYKW